MQFNDTTNKYNGIIQRYEMLTNRGDTSISGNAYALQEAVAFANDAVNKATTWIQEVDNAWRYQDSKLTDFPMATTTLVANQRDYTNIFSKIIAVEVKDINGNYYKLGFNPGLLNKQDGKWQEEAGLPTEYYLFGGSIILDVKPSASCVTLAEGLRVTHQPDADLFVATDTTQEPGFLTRFHVIVPTYMAMMWGDVYGMPCYKTNYIRLYGDGGNEKGLKKELQRAYAFPTEDFKPKLGSKFINIVNSLVR